MWNTFILYNSIFLRFLYIIIFFALSAGLVSKPPSPRETENVTELQLVNAAVDHWSADIMLQLLSFDRPYVPHFHDHCDGRGTTNGRAKLSCWASHQSLRRCQSSFCPVAAERSNNPNAGFYSWDHGAIFSPQTTPRDS